MLATKSKKSVSVKDSKIDLDNLLFYFVESNSSFKIEHLMGYDAVVLDAQDEQYTLLIIKKFRSHRNPEYYLKPILLLNSTETNNPIIKELSDGVLFSLDSLPEQTPKVRDIFLKTTQVDPTVPDKDEERVLKKVFDFMYTRDIKSLVPFVDHHSSVGYTWPPISVNFQHHEESRVLELLEWAQKEQLLTAEFKDRVYLCGNCSNGFLLYREVCPHCASANVQASDIIHHFPCAYVGPVADYRKEAGDVLVCPKCRKALRHIGVDYDKPSIVNHCNNCDKNFQDVYVKAKCISCCNDVEVQYLISHNINEYKIASKGASVATGAAMSFTGKDLMIPGAVPYDAFKMMVHYQLERVRNNPQMKSYLMTMLFENIARLKDVIGIKSIEKLLEDIVNLIRQNIQSSDIISVKEHDLLLVCINDIDQAAAEELSYVIKMRIFQMVKDNLTGFELECKNSLHPLTIFHKTEELFAAATQSIN
jgi:GGDEF domain-containing protein